MSGFQPLDLSQSSAAEFATASPSEDLQLPELQPSAAALDPAERGYQEGVQAGLQHVESQTRGLLNALAGAAAEIRESQERALRELENQAALLAYDLACGLADAHIQVHPESIQSAARHALGEITEADNVVLFVHPDDLALLDSELLALSGQHLALRADPSLQRGGCRVETVVGDIDATRQSRKESLSEQIQNLIKERS